VCLALNDIAHRIIVGEVLLLGGVCHMLPPPPSLISNHEFWRGCGLVSSGEVISNTLSHRPVTSDNDLLGTSHCYDLTIFPVLISDYLQQQWLFLHVSSRS
jgi:hypothetical protein